MQDRRPEPGSAAYYRLTLVLGTLSAIGPLAIDLYLPSFPTIARELSTTPSAVQLTVAVYFVGLSLGQSLYGPSADRYGRKRPLYLGLLLFIAASLICARARSVQALLAGRLLQALGGCAEIVVARAMVRDCFDSRDAIRVLSLLLLVMGVAPILAPLAGAQILAHLGWRAVFWVLTGFGALGLLAAAWLLPESLPPERRRRQTPRQIAAVYGALLRDRSFMGYALSGNLIMAGMFAYIAASPFVFIELFQMPPGRYGLLFGANALGLVLAAQLNARLARTLAPRGVLCRVLPVTALAAALLLLDTLTGFGGLPGIALPLFVCVASVGFTLPNTVVLAMAPYGQIAGSASALLGTLQFLLGAAAGAAVSALNDGSAAPLGWVIAACAAGALLAFRAIPATPQASRIR